MCLHYNLWHVSGHTRTVVCIATNQHSQLRIRVHSYSNTYLHDLCMKVGLSRIVGIRHMCYHDEYGQSRNFASFLGQATWDRHIGSIQVIDTGSRCNGAVSGTKQSRGMEVPRPLIYLSPKKVMVDFVKNVSTPVTKQRVLMHGHQGWNVRHGLCHIYMRYVYIYIWVVYSLCLFCCLFIPVTWWYVWCFEWASRNQEEVQACLVTLWLSYHATVYTKPL